MDSFLFLNLATHKRKHTFHNFRSPPGIIDRFLQGFFRQCPVIEIIQRERCITFQRRQQVIHLVCDHMADCTDIGEMLEPGELGFQGIILVFLDFNMFMQRQAFFRNTCQFYVPTVKFRYLNEVYRLLKRFFLKLDKCKMAPVQ